MSWSIINFECVITSAWVQVAWAKCSHANMKCLWCGSWAKGAVHKGPPVWRLYKTTFDCRWGRGVRGNKSTVEWEIQVGLREWECPWGWHSLAHPGLFYTGKIGLCQLLTETKTSRLKCPARTSPVCKAAVLLVKSHVDSRNAAMSLYQIRVYVVVSLPAVIPVGTDCGLGWQVICFTCSQLSLVYQWC